jgi:hypothetical protein
VAYHGGQPIGTGLGWLQRPGQLAGGARNKPGDHLSAQALDLCGVATLTWWVWSLKGTACGRGGRVRLVSRGRLWTAESSPQRVIDPCMSAASPMPHTQCVPATVTSTTTGLGEEPPPARAARPVDESCGSNGSAPGEQAAFSQQLDVSGRVRLARSDVYPVFGTGACCRRAGD